MFNSPEWFNLVHTSQNVTYSNIHINATATTPNTTNANTDGWDIYRSDQVIIKDSVIFNGDDCVSFKPSQSSFCTGDKRLLVLNSFTDATNILVSNLTCSGSQCVLLANSRAGKIVHEYANQRLL